MGMRHEQIINKLKGKLSCKLINIQYAIQQNL